MSLIVLLSTYNGEKYLKEQLDSLVNQELLPDKILIRDDGSKDNTVTILEDYSKKYKYIEYYKGNNIGAAKSFFELINKTNNYDYYALCDQDDIWLKDKLKVAVERLKKEDNNIPLLYASKFTLVDEYSKPMKMNISPLYNYNDFAHSLLYQSAPGCTMVFNNIARNKIIKYDINKEFLIIHDSIIHKVITCFGKMILDDNSYIQYRMHSGNEIGMPSNKYKQFILRLNKFFTSKNKGYRKQTAKSLLNVYKDELTNENKHLLEIVSNYQNDKNLKKELLTLDCFKSKTINDLFFKIMVLVNYI